MRRCQRLSRNNSESFASISNWKQIGRREHSKNFDKAIIIQAIQCHLAVRRRFIIIWIFRWSRRVLNECRHFQIRFKQFMVPLSQSCPHGLDVFVCDDRKIICHMTTNHNVVQFTKSSEIAGQLITFCLGGGKKRLKTLIFYDISFLGQFYFFCINLYEQVVEAVWPELICMWSFWWYFWEQP